MGVSFNSIWLFQHFTENLSFTHSQRMAPPSDKHLVISARLNPDLPVRWKSSHLRPKLWCSSIKQNLFHIYGSQKIACLATILWSIILPHYKMEIFSKLRCNSIEDICVTFEVHEEWHALPPLYDEQLAISGLLSS